MFRNNYTNNAKDITTPQYCAEVMRIINYVPVTAVSNLNNAIRMLKDAGFWIVSSSGDATTNYQDLKYDFPVVLVIGNEGDGVSQLVIKNSDYLVKIPMYGQVNSLNASVATGILLSRIKG